MSLPSEEKFSAARGMKYPTCMFSPFSTHITSEYGTHEMAKLVSGIFDLQRRCLWGLIDASIASGFTKYIQTKRNPIM
jgi:hypothetical protein